MSATRTYKRHWLFCPGCWRQRIAVNEKMRAHRKWNGIEMVPCEGQGQRGSYENNLVTKA